MKADYIPFAEFRDFAREQLLAWKAADPTRRWRALAEESGVADNQLTLWLRTGKNLSSESIARILEAIGVKTTIMATHPREWKSRR